MSHSDNLSRVPAHAPAPFDGAELEERVMLKVTLRLIPFLFLLYMLNILDRINIGYARLQFLDDLHMNDPRMKEEIFARAASVFFIGYFLFEVPSNLILRHTGARRWIGRIMISWGIVSASMMFVTVPWGFYLLRFLLGLAEAGFFPGIILYVSYWFPARHRARAISRFMTASAITGIIGGPLSGAIMHFLDGQAGLRGWQWLFLLEGLPSVMVGLIALKYLTDYPRKAHWLLPHEREWLTERMNQEEAHRVKQQSFSLWQGFTNPRVLLLCTIYFTVAMGSNSYGAYHPTIIRDAFKNAIEDFNEFHVGLLAMCPSLTAALSMMAVGYHSDRTGERRWHVGMPGCCAATGWFMVGYCKSPVLVLLGLVLAQAGMLSMLAPFWALPTSFLSGSAAAGGIAFINSVGNLGGAVGPTVIAWAQKETGSFANGFYFIAGVLVLGAVLVQLARHDRGLEAKT